jgi:hypothetical protein
MTIDSITVDLEMIKKFIAGTDVSQDPSPEGAVEKPAAGEG